MSLLDDIRSRIPKKKPNYRFDIRCSNCGRFCIPADSGTVFGGYWDLEPPDSELFCKKCVKKLYKEAIKTGEIPMYWQKPLWTVRAARALGYTVDNYGLWTKPADNA